MGRQGRTLTPESTRTGRWFLSRDLVAVSAAAAGAALKSGRTAAAAAPYIISRRVTASMGALNRRGGVLLALKAHLRTGNGHNCHGICAV